MQDCCCKAYTNDACEEHARYTYGETSSELQAIYMHPGCSRAVGDKKCFTVACLLLDRRAHEKQRMTRLNDQQRSLC